MLSLNSVRCAPGPLSALAVAACLVLSCPEKGLATEAVIVTATRLAQPASQVLADVFTIDRQTLERQIGSSISEVLRTVPGIELAQNGGSASTTNVYLRGAEKRHVLVLIDGVPFDSQSTGGATWEALPLQVVDRIEVLSGPASAAYGSDAVAGVIQIFTRQGEGAPRLAWGAGIGDQGYLGTDLSALGAIGALDYSVAIQTAQSEGFNARSNALATSLAADRDGYQRHSTQLRLGYRLSPGQRLQLGVISQHLNAGYDASTRSGSDDRSIKDMSSANASWSAQWLPPWHSVLTLGQSTDHYETRPSVYQTDTRLQTASLLNRLVLGEHTLNATLERREDHLVNSSLVASISRGKGDRADNGLGLGYGWLHEAVTLSGSVRHDQDSEFGDHLTGAVAAGYELSPAWRVRASWGTAYKAPTLYQRFSEYGNPDLQAEHSLTRELGLQFREGELQAGLTAYHTRVDNLINYAQAGVCASSSGCYRNTARAQLKGLEATVSTTWVGVRLSGSVDLGSPKDLDTDRQLARRARRHASLRAETDWASWHVGLQAQTYGRRFDSSASSTVLPGYSVWGLDASRDLNTSWKLLARVENLLDKAYQTASTYASSPRAVYLAVRWTPAN